MSYISDKVAVVMKSPSSGDRHEHDKEVKAHEKLSVSQLCKRNKLGELEDEVKKGELEEEDNIERDQHNKEEYYEVEAIRNKRNHNGQLQYLIKWTNYPETDNTWEPYDNIKYCTDMLEDFEHSLQKRKSKSALSKMKRSSIQTEDCGEGAMNPAGGERDGKKSSVRALTIERDIHIRRNPDRNINSVYKKEKYKLKLSEDEAMTIEISMPLPKGVDEINKEGDTNFVMQDYVRKWRQKEEAKAGVGAAAMAIFLPKCKANIAAHGEVPPVSPIGYLYSEFEPQSKKEGKRLTGAARRKSGRVTRFVHPDELAKKVMNVEVADSTEAITASVVATDTDTEAITASVVATDTDTGTDTDTTIGSNSKMAPEDLHITEILKPVHVQLFATSSAGTNNISHACITFKALRSDGSQVLVNNRELRATNPLLLIDFYEKHLRCTDTWQICIALPR